MLILIQKDGATTVPREVADIAAARAIAIDTGMPVFVVVDGANVPIAEYVEPEALEAGAAAVAAEPEADAAEDPPEAG